MNALRILLYVFGILAFAMGLLWIGQGMGYVRWPANSFMIDLSVWTIRGSVLAVAGLVMILIARRMPRR